MQYFGTDGIRGNVQTKLTPSFVSKLGVSTGAILKKNKIEKICIGQDPRISSEFISKILIATINSMGIDVVNLGVVSTPAVSYTIINNNDINYGIMISASHNPYYDNGIKYFGTDGKKLNETLENEIETILLKSEEIQINIDDIGKEINGSKFVQDYIDYLCGKSSRLSNLNIALDLANGSATKIAPEVFKKLGANIQTVGNNPDGYNINKEVGSTHTEKFSEFIKNNDFDFGFSYDGDADRIILLDGNGEVLDGDYIIYLLAKYFKNNNMLKNNSIVSTVMTNIGFKKAIEKLGIKNIETAVGDKYVMREMEKSNSVLGGEQSGHIILFDHLPTGDGILTSIILADILKNDITYLDQIKEEMVKYPQRLVNYECDNKSLIIEDEKFNEYINQQSEKLANKGRILVRPSGTENLIRVMVESQNITECDEIIEKIIGKMEKI